MCYFIDLITLLCPTACASVAMNTPSDTSVDGEIQLNQRTLDAFIQSITAKLQEATKASTGPSTGEFGCGHIASEVQDKFIPICYGWPQDMFIQHITLRPLAGSCTRLCRNCWMAMVQGFAQPLQHCIRPQSSVTSLYGTH